MKEKIIAAKNDDKSSIEKIKENEKAMSVLLEFMNIADAIRFQLMQINEITENERKLEFKKGYEQGQQDALKEKQPSKYFDKEAYRALHELEIKNRWSNLY
ncbi:MAG: hypothetical protein ACT4ON_01095 [Bacteroidota bacterium]